MKTHGDVKLHRGTGGNALKCLTPPGQLLLQPAKRVLLKKTHLLFLNLHLDQAIERLPTCKFILEGQSWSSRWGSGVTADGVWQMPLLATTLRRVEKRSNHVCERYWMTIYSTSYAHIFSPAITTGDCSGYACKGQMEVKGTCTPACRREHLPVNQWDGVSSVAQLFDMQRAFLCKCVWTASDTLLWWHQGSGVLGEGG